MKKLLMVTVLMIGAITTSAQGLLNRPGRLEGLRHQRGNSSSAVSAARGRQSRSTKMDGGKLYYIESDGEIQIESFVRMWLLGESRFATVSLTIPSVLDGCPVTSIGNDAFKNLSDLTEVTIPESVTSIGDGAFCHCDGLTSVTIPSSVISIGERAFSGCSALSSVLIPASVKNIGVGAFSMTPFYEDMSDGFVILGGGCLLAYKGECPPTVVIPSNVTSIGAHVFANNGFRAALSRSSSRGRMSSVLIPSSVRVIGEGAFFNCSGLTSVTIPPSVTNIRDFAFCNCSGLTSVEIPPNVEIIGANAFSGCRGLISVTLPSSLTCVGKGAFSDCSGLTSVTIPDGVTSIGEKMFYECRGLTSLAIPSSVTNIESMAFSGCSALTSMTIPPSMTSIGEGAFSGCGGLTSVTIPDGVTSIGEKMFYRCSGLTSVSIPSSVTSIGESAFCACTNLASVSIPRGVTDIGSSAFYGTPFYHKMSDGFVILGDGVLYDCKGLREALTSIPDGVKTIVGGVFRGSESVTIPSSVTRICRRAFSQSEITSVTIPSSVTNIGAEAFSNCKRLSTVTISKGEASMSIEKDAFKDCTGLRSITLPKNVASIEAGAFIRCCGLTSVTIPDGVRNIERDTFHDCRGLTSVTIPSSVTDIGVWAFSGCSGLTSIMIPSSVTNIGFQAFSGCSGLKSVVIPLGVTRVEAEVFSGCKGLVSVSIPSSVTSIKQCAFRDCTNLMSVTIPSSVTNIGPRAFSGCKGLASVTIPSNVTSIGGGAFTSCHGLTSVEMPESVEGPEGPDSDVFADCNRLTSVTISAGGPRRHGKGKFFLGFFSDCNGLKAVTISEGVKNVDRWFSGCSGFKSVSIPFGVTNIAACAFMGCEGLESVTIPSSVTSIGVNAFRGCGGLTSVTIPPGVNSIADEAFGGCSGLKSLSISSTVAKIAPRAFMGCTNLKSVDVVRGEKVETMSFEDFCRQWQLENPANVLRGRIGLRRPTRLGQPAMTNKNDDATNVAARHPVGLRRPQVLGGSLRARRMARQQTAQEAAKKQTADAAAKDAEWQAQAEQGKAEREAERAQQRQRLMAIQEELRKAREAKQREEDSAEAQNGTDKSIASRCASNRAVGAVTPSVRKEDFKAKLTGIAIIEGGRMCGYESRARKADFQSPDRPIEIPYGKAACFRVEYDFPESYQARVWANARWLKGQDGRGCSFGSNPSPLYKGKGVAYGFLDMLERGKTCTLKQLAIQTNAEPKLEGLSNGWDIVVASVDIKFQGPETVQKTMPTGEKKVVLDNQTQGKNVVAEKLQGCDFLLNKDFKKNAKYYLCLFSASWCPPCRAEMPRIAKTYVETLKDDPDIELIHFSRDQNDEKAMAWAKEHDVKFPVVKPNGGNPLELHCSGIPHLFIVKADGTLVEEGHPMRIFNEEKFKELRR